MILTSDYQLISTITLTHGYVRTYARYIGQDKITNKTTYALKSTYYITNYNTVSFSSATANLAGVSKSYGYTTMYRGETTIQEFTKTVDHYNDGSSPDISVYTSWNASYGGSGDATGYIQMPKIQRIPTITTATDFNDEENPYLEFTNPAGFVIKPFLNFYYTYDKSKVLYSINRDENITSPYNWTITSSERAALRNKLNDQKEYTVAIGVNAYDSSGNYIGIAFVNKKMTFINAEPTFTCSFLETDANVISVLGSSANKIIKNASKVKTTINPTALKSATIKSVEIIHGTSDVVLTASPYEQVLTALTNTFEVIVTDSRGYTVTQTLTKELIDYLPIEISQYSFKRVSPTSSDIKLNASIKYKQQTFNTTKNTPTIKWKLGANGTLNTISSSDYTLDATNNEITITDLLLEDLLPYTQQGKLYLLVNDLLTSDAENQIVIVGIPVFDYGEFDLQVNGDLYIADRNRQNRINIKNLVGGGGYDSLPVGSIVPFSSENLPTGYLLCDGSEISRSSYEGLFDVIGTTFGEGNGSTTFNLPNLKGRVLVGLSDITDSKFNVDLGTSLGEEEHQLTIAEMPVHRHEKVNVGGNYLKAWAGNGSESSLNLEDLYGARGQQNYVSTGDAGGNQSHNIIQPSLVVNYIIKASGTAILNGNVVDSLEDNSTTNAPSQRAVTEAINGVVESGSNSNGSYTKFSDGTLICKKAVTVNASMKAWFGDLWYDDLSMGNWAYSFVDTNGPIVNATINNNQYWLASCAYYNQTSAGTCRILRMNELNQSVTFNIIGFGRWK